MELPAGRTSAAVRSIENQVEMAEFHGHLKEEKKFTFRTRSFLLNK